MTALLPGSLRIVSSATDVAVLFQNPDDMLFRPVVEQDVAFGPENLGLSKDEVERRVEEALFMVGMQDFRKSGIMRLSYGQRKRVAIAGVLAMRPKVLIMDEPTASLDYGNQLRVLEQVRSLSEQGYTVLLSTHDPQHALRFSRRVLALQGGRVAAEGDTRSVLTPDLIRQLYGVESVLLDTPDGAALLPVRGGDRHV